MKKFDCRTIKTSVPSLGQKPHFYEDGVLVQEQTEAFGLLKFFYTHPIGKKLRPLLAKRCMSKLAGVYQNSRLSKRSIAPFIKKHAIQMADFEKPASHYRTFNEFFYRKFKPGIRSVDMRSQIVTSPVDGKLFVIDDLNQATEFFVKNKRFNLEQFLRNKELARYYQHGVLMIFRLAPYDYHRFHFPVSCVPSDYQVLAGMYESVNPLVYASGVQPLTENQRHLILLRTDHFGQVLMMPVGAMFVGCIVETYKAQIPSVKGDEVGYFEFGGSTVVLLFKQGTIKPLQSIVEHSRQGIETAVKMGQAVTE